MGGGGKEGREETLIACGGEKGGNFGCLWGGGEGEGGRECDGWSMCSCVHTSSV